MVKVKVIPQQAEVAQGVPGSLRPRIFLTFGTTRLAGRQPNAPAAFTPGKSLVLIFRGWVDPRAPSSVESYGKNSPVTRPGIDPGTSRIVAQCLNHYATPRPVYCYVMSEFRLMMRHKGSAPTKETWGILQTKLPLRNVESSSAGVAAPWRGDKTFALRHCFHCVDVSAVCENGCLKGMRINGHIISFENR